LHTFVINPSTPGFPLKTCGKDPPESCCGGNSQDAGKKDFQFCHARENGHPEEVVWRITYVID